MNLLKTPPRMPGLIGLMTLLVVLGFFLLPAQFFFGTFNPYFSDRDSGDGPAAFYWLFAYPFELETLTRRRHYQGGDSLLSWSRKHPRYAWLSLLLTIVACTPSVICLIDAIRSEMYYFVLYFVLRIYAFLLLRCARIRYYDDDATWLANHPLRNRPRH